MILYFYTTFGSFAFKAFKANQNIQLNDYYNLTGAHASPIKNQSYSIDQSLRKKKKKKKLFLITLLTRRDLPSKVEKKELYRTLKNFFSFTNCLLSSAQRTVSSTLKKKKAKKNISNISRKNKQNFPIKYYLNVPPSNYNFRCLFTFSLSLIIIIFFFLPYIRDSLQEIDICLF